MDRRAFCLGTASGIAAMAALGGSAVARSASDAVASPFATVVIDGRFATGRAFGAAAARAGSSILTFHGDLTQMWVRQLKPLWASDGGPIAGLTTVAGLFCLEQLAKDHWLRMVARTPVGATREGPPFGGSEGLIASLAARRPIDTIRPRREPIPAAELVAWVIAKS